MGLLIAFNRYPCFNPQTQQLVLISMAELFQKLNPLKFPAFAFSWIELISHKYFMPHFLQANTSQHQQLAAQKAQVDLGGLKPDNIFFDKYHKFMDLICSLFQFLKMNMSPHHKAPPALAAFYQATLRVCLTILHDFPEFFCNFHFNFVNNLPDHCIQLKNIILSAYPQSITLPSPFKKKLKVDLLEESKQLPGILSNFENFLQIFHLREDLESFVRTKNQGLIDQIC
mmetsp:Transcript_48325/g.35511  ORF Transcript_48325/g.35511 Transcript_48325/m.35511 type:complete len:228 (+) Transcript_48325:875-1558(+)